MTITQIKAFAFGDGSRIEFCPASDIGPGFTHKVYVLRDFKVVAKDWFSPVAGKISKKVARFYYEKHITPKEAA